MYAALYALHLAVVLAALIYAGSKQSFVRMSPGFIFTICLSYSFYSDFFVRAYDDPRMESLSSSQLLVYQGLILFVYIIGVAYALHRSNRWPYRNVSLVEQEESVPVFLAEVIGWFLIALELLKRVVACKGDLVLAVQASLAPRYQNPWSSARGALGDNTWYYTITMFLLPVGGICFALVAADDKKGTLVRLRSCLGLAVVFGLLITYGSRTYAAMPILFLILRYLLSRRSSMRKLTMLTATTALLAVTFTFLVAYRSAGLGSVMDDNKEKQELKYHQDDSYYRLISAAYVSEYTGTKIDPYPFFLVILCNPIPRVIWENKPALFNDYYGDFKDYYVTITFLGELIAMFGVPIGCAAGILALMLCYHIIEWGFRMVPMPLGTGNYLIMIIYSYLCMRSLINISLSLYFVICVVFFSYLIRQLKLLARIYQVA